jgi:hypothetical protein
VRRFIGTGILGETLSVGMHRQIGKGSDLITLTSPRTAQPIRDRVQDMALNSLSLRERVRVRGYRLIRRGNQPLTRA